MPSNTPCTCRECLRFRKEQDRRDIERQRRWDVIKLTEAYRRSRTG